MHAFSKDQKLQLYPNIYEFFIEFFPIRFELYEKRKIYILQKLQDDMKDLKNKVRFILQIVRGELRMQEMRKDELLNYLSINNYDKHLNSKEPYQYLLNMPYVSCTIDQAQKIEKSYMRMLEDYENFKKTNVREIWLQELDDLEKNLKIFYDTRIQDRNSDGTEISSLEMMKTKMSKKRKRK